MKLKLFSGFQFVLICSLMISLICRIALASEDSTYSPPSSDLKVTLTTHHLCPYGCYAENTKPAYHANENFKGVAIEVVSCAFKKINVPLDVLVVPWERAQTMAKTGESHGFFAASHKATRDEFATMSAIIADQKWQWFLLKTNPHYPTHPSFKTNTTVAGFNGSNMLSWMEDNNYRIEGKPKDTEHLLKMLLAERVDAVMANNYVMDELLIQHKVKEKVKVFTHKDKPLGVYFSNVFLAHQPGFLTRFNKAVRECRSN